MTNHATWMSNPQTQNLTFGDLKIPGTHDSGSYSLTTTLSQMPYPQISFLWSLNPGAAPADGSPPWTGGTYYVGGDLYNFIMTVVTAVAQSQDQSILEQLNGGIRYFDLRIYYDTSANDFYVQHGLRGCSLGNILQQVQQFIQENPTSQELIILNLSHTNFLTLGTPSPTTLTNQVASLVTGSLGGNVYMPANAAGNDFDLQSLSNLQVGSITNNKPAVMVLNTDQGLTYATTVINTAGFSNSGRGAGGVDNVQDLISAEEGPLQANPQGTLYQVNWTLTPGTSDAITQAQNSALDNGAAPVLQQLALEANNALTAFIQSNQSRAFNLITVDWYETGAPMTVVDLCVALNTGQSI